MVLLLFDFILSCFNVSFLLGIGISNDKTNEIVVYIILTMLALLSAIIPEMLQYSLCMAFWFLFYAFHKPEKFSLFNEDAL